MMDNALLYLAAVLAIITILLHRYLKTREKKFQAKKAAWKRKKICEDTAIISHYTEQRLSINLMALDAARQMCAAAANQSADDHFS